MKGVSIDDTKLSGTYANDVFSFSYPDYFRRTTFNTPFFAINSATVTVDSSYTGFIGIRPHTARAAEEDKMENTLYRAQKNGHIDNLVVGLYIDDDKGKGSLIKVGSWDQIAIQEGHELEMIRCPTDSAWTLEVTSLKFAG
jgi:hypothetical protein